MEQLVEERTRDVLLTKAKNGGRSPADTIFDYLDHKEWNRRLETIVGLSGGSKERLKRVFMAIMPEKRWSDISKDESVRREIANFLADSTKYVGQIPQFVCYCFLLREDWIKALQNEVICSFNSKSISSG